MENHTEKFNRLITNDKEKKISNWKNVNFSVASLFLSRVSQQLKDSVIGEITKNKKVNYAENREIYAYCINNGIEPDVDPYDNYSDSQAEIDFSYNESDKYKKLTALESTKIEKRECLVLSNEERDGKNVLTVQFDENDEIKEIEY